MSSAKTSPKSLAHSDLRGADVFASPQRVAVVFEDCRSTYSFTRDARDRDRVTDELLRLLPLASKACGRELTLADSTTYAHAIAAASRKVEPSEDPHEDPYPGMDELTEAKQYVGEAEFAEEVAELALDGIIQRAYYADILRAHPELTPDHVYYISNHHGNLGVLRRRPEWGPSTEVFGNSTIPFTDRVLAVVTEDDMKEGVVYAYDLAVGRPLPHRNS